MRVAAYLSIAVAAMALSAGAASAQQVRAGGDFRANTYTQNIQRRPDVAFKADGDFVVTWMGANAGDTAYGIFGQRYDAAGAAQGGEFHVNTFTPGYQFRPVAAADKKGNFVVVWSSAGQDGDGYGVFAQRFAADGTRSGGEFQVNSYTTGSQGSSYYLVEQNQAVAMGPKGNFVVVWGSYGGNQDGSSGSVHGQRFDNAGARVGGEFQINTATTGYQFGPSVAMRPDSSFVVAWTTLDGSGYGVAGQRFDAAGVKVGAEFQIPAATANDQLWPVVRSRPTGEFTVTWTERATLIPPAGEIFARQFDATGTPVGAPFQVNTYTTGLQYTYGLAMDLRGNFVVNWNNHTDNDGTAVGGRRFRGDGSAREPESVVNAFTTGFQSEATVASDDVGNVISAWRDDARDGSSAGVFVQRFGGLRPTALAVDTTRNGVFEPGETSVVLPSWRNVNGAAQTFGGGLSNATGPAGATYAITDATASYGTVANGATGSCGSDCYAVSVSNPAVRPVLHWDASVLESITPDAQGQQKEWVLHIGNTFTDVPTSSPFYRFIETLIHNNVTSGCGPTTYCPGSSTTRGQMAVFVIVAREDPGYAPPACITPIFPDLPASSPFCRWVEELVRRGVVSGCGSGNYCPADPVTREQMAVFVLRMRDPNFNPPPCTTSPFPDVPPTSPFCRWVAELVRRGVVSGCGGTNYCPGLPVTREQMAVFIVVTFGLALYGP